MSDHTVPFEGSDSSSRQRSPTPGDPKYHYESLNDITTSPATSAPYTRRRPSRTSSGSKGTPPSASPPRGDDHDDSEQRNKPPRNTLKKLLRRDSHHTDTGSTLQGKQEEVDEKGGTIGYMPRLGQIRESKSKVSTRTRRRGSSVVSTPVDPRVLRRRHTGENAVKRSHARDKRSSLQRHAGNMANMSDPSLVSSVTQQSDASGGSSSTVLQRPYNGYSQVAQYLEPEESQSPFASTAMESPAFNMTSTAPPAVFQYLQSSDDTAESYTPTPTDLQAMPPSTIASSSSSSSSGDTQHDDGRSSVAADSQHTIDSGMTSPASTRRSLQTSSHPNQEFRKFKKPLYASSFVHGPGDEVEPSQEEGSEGSDSGSESEEEEEEVNQKNQIPSNNSMETAPYPPRAPSTTSRQSDPHGSRLKQQEQELANHILQAPQPHNDYQYGNLQPAYNHNYAPMPMYSPQGYSGASPTAMNAAVSSPQAWFPPPLAIGYAPQSPEQVHAHPNKMLQHLPPQHGSSHAPPYSHQQATPSPHATIIGYELLATELSAATSSPRKKGGLVPLYRKFSHLNHRVLLHLQDEVAELEEELRHLDECVAQITPRDADGYAYPSSRRRDARFGGDVHFKRTELLGKVYQKLEQYNKALLAFGQMNRELEGAGKGEVRAYREWMDEVEAVDEAESQFLERDGDLVSVAPRKMATVTPTSTTTSTAQSAAPSPYSAITFPLLLILPLIAFAIVPSLLGRIVVIGLAVSVAGKVVRETPQLVGLLAGRDWCVAAAM
ncbi:hypothetical protein G6011_08106 [Alternaria panax]|uniref:DUF6594 domain-containing protein n=1 Tax=Alternaria panax TaxID=48097 RepID=A0AAD4I8E0_9PLEO|nr:hypothetical protein G6011_08106 [Alternaria panax]